MNNSAETKQATGLISLDIRSVAFRYLKQCLLIFLKCPVSSILFRNVYSARKAVYTYPADFMATDESESSTKIGRY
jgi:hypothetical protein